MKYGDPGRIIEVMIIETLRVHGAAAFAAGFAVYHRLSAEAQFEVQRAVTLLNSPDTSVPDKSFCTEYLRSMLELRHADTTATDRFRQLTEEEKAGRA